MVDNKLSFPPPIKSMEPIDIADISKWNNNESITVQQIATKVMGTVQRKTEAGYVESQVFIWEIKQDQYCFSSGNEL